MFERDEVVILPLPTDISEMMAAAQAYFDQYGVVADLAVRGRVRLQGGQVATIADWCAIARFDSILGLMGIGEPDETDDELIWAAPLGPGEVKVMALEEEN